MNQNREPFLRKYAKNLAQLAFDQINEHTIGTTSTVSEADFFQNEVLQELGYLIHGQQANQTTVTRENARQAQDATPTAQAPQIAPQP